MAVHPCLHQKQNTSNSWDHHILHQIIRAVNKRRSKIGKLVLVLLEDHFVLHQSALNLHPHLIFFLSESICVVTLHLYLLLFMCLFFPFIPPGIMVYTELSD
ncbi:hypothetical protein ILYODFUR_035190 [Ilyodon furcidens]|uniref:Uncharacterized protein n=1 Tax=Ilyodon furcidens TaxID=33524 RepID=A0ABV0TR82_9TELE